MERAGRRGSPDAAGPWTALARPEAFPDDPSAARGVEWVQTHISYVYLTAERVYKFRKPVDLGFVDFTARSERDADCLREVALNRRLAPDVYLGVAPLGGTDEAPRVGAPAEALAERGSAEHCVVMRRLPEGRAALSLLRADALTPAMLDALAARLAPFHADCGLGRPAPFDPEAWCERCTAPVRENFRILAEAPGDRVPLDLLARARERAARFADECADRFERRRRDGRAVDAHGDLHLDHVWYERDDAPPLAIDCLEFDERLRRIDTASEVAFLAMDLRYRGAPRLAELFLGSYAREADDYDLYAVVDYFVAYRAGVRAKVAALASRDAGIAGAQRAAAAKSAREHLALAADALQARPPPALVLVGGIVGTGKSSVARALAERLGAVVIASDAVRKRLLGVETTTRLSQGWGEGAYSPQARQRVYDELLGRAGPPLDAGRPVILDATFSRRAQRDAAAALARERGLRAFSVETCCAPALVRERLAHRAEADTDASDAGPEAYEASARGYEPPQEWPEERRLRIDTGRDGWREAAGELARRIAPAPG